ncbi:MAG TPA: N-acetylmuramoyl-L-alanine amidase [Longimicrobium sp.]|jgi:N-acetylmuramoyl-L-alanine amidase|uniref:N-acetylmuramoyl-L-alanine amidase n=1 Tax=Longimicrobium sp. TaxID=2029185 RepID=UPI002EDADE42
MMIRTRPAGLLVLALLSACTGGRRAGPDPAPQPVDASVSVPMTSPGVDPPIRNDLPPVPARSGPLRISVAYPGENAALATADSNFIFGSVGTGGATLTINGAPVEVAANGAFLGFVPVPADGVYRLRAAAGGQTAERTVTVRVPARSGAAVSGISAGTLAPRGAITGYPGERVTVRFRGAPGGRAQIRMPDGATYPLAETRVMDRAEGFMQDQAVAAREVSEYAGTFPITTPLGVPGDTARASTIVAGQDAAAQAVVELFHGAEVARVPLPLSVAVLREGDVRLAVASASRPGGMAIGTAVPGSGTPYHWFFPNGTRFTVTGEREGAYRVRLTSDLSVWVAAGDVRLMPEGAPPAAGTVGTVRVDPDPAHVDLRLVTSDRLPFEVRVVDDRWMEVRVYGAESRANWLHYGTEDPLVRRVEWQQERDDLFVVRMELAEAVWGWRAFWDERGSLVVRVRRPPRVDGARPLQGLRIAIDAGHPPGGAIGPTGLTEAEANLAISKQLVRMLREAGAEVLETRPDTAAVDLGVRPVRAAEWDAHLLVSVHNNAFPDGVNPWENNGTSVFYNQPQSLGLARHAQRELLRELGLRDLGIARADLALVRPTWMPSVLTETMFLMVPQQEAALRDPAVHGRIARAHFRAIEAFLRERAEAGRTAAGR